MFVNTIFFSFFLSRSSAKLYVPSLICLIYNCSLFLPLPLHIVCVRRSCQSVILFCLFAFTITIAADFYFYYFTIHICSQWFTFGAHFLLQKLAATARIQLSILYILVSAAPTFLGVNKLLASINTCGVSATLKLSPSALNRCFDAFSSRLFCFCLIFVFCLCFCAAAGRFLC